MTVQPYDIAETKDVLIPLPDGASLAANLVPPEGEPHRSTIAGKTVERASNRVIRDLDGSAATFGRLEASTQTLDDGPVVTMARHNWSTVARDRPEDAVFSSRMTARVERPADPVSALVETVRTRESFRVDARIELAVRPFYARSWELPLDER
jgi:hypothetical protein